jgi:hypothetical protein
MSDAIAATGAADNKEMMQKFFIKSLFIFNINAFAADTFRRTRACKLSRL